MAESHANDTFRAPQPAALNSRKSLSARQEALVKKKFNTADKGKDGHLSRDEFASMFPPEQRRQSVMIFKNLDTDGSGLLNYDEFVATAEKVKKNYDSKRKKTFQDRRTLLLPMKRLFKRLDSSGDRRLNKQEFSRLWRVLEIPEEVAEHTMKNLFKLVDTNRDGYISNREFKEAFIESGLLDEVCESVFSADLVEIPKEKSARTSKKEEEQEATKRQSLKEKFDSLDNDKDGLLTLTQLRNFCYDVFIKNVDGVVNSVDPDDKGRFGFDEFCDCMSRANFMTAAEVKALEKSDGAGKGTSKYRPSSREIS